MDPTGHGFFSFLEDFFAALFGAAITALTWGAAGPVVAGMLGGMVAGATGAAMHGAGLIGIVQGAFMGALGGGIAGGAFLEGIPWPVMAAGGLALAGGTGGVKGLESFAAGFAGGLAGGVLGDYLNKAITSNIAQAADYQNAVDDLARQRQALGDYNADYYGYTHGTYNPNLDAAGETIYDGQTVDAHGNTSYYGHIEYGPTAFDVPSLPQAVGANESWKLNALYEGQWQIVGDQVLNRCELEMGAEAWTINNAARLNMTPLVTHLMIQQYNYYSNFIDVPHWGK